MRALITGATGFIGSVLARTCRSSGWDVRALGQVNNDVERERAADLSSDGIDVSSLDLSSSSRLDEQLADVDVVFHLAAAQHEMNVPDSHFWSVNVDGTRRLLDSSARAGVRRFVHGSTIGVYGEGSVDAPDIDESTEPAPVNIYGITKLAGEKAVLEQAGRLDVSVVRISETYGPGDRRLLKLFRAIKAGRFLLIGRCANIHQPIYVDDLVDILLLAAADAAAVGEVFVASGAEKLTTQEMCEAVATAVGASLRGFRLPMTPFLAAAVVLERTLRPLGIQPPLHTRRLDFFRKSFSFSIDKVADVLGYRPATDFATGSVRTADWYRERALLAP